MTDVTEGAGDIHVLEDTDMTPRNQDTDGDGFDGERFGNVMTKAYNVIKETGRGMTSCHSSQKYQMDNWNLIILHCIFYWMLGTSCQMKQYTI